MEAVVEVAGLSRNSLMNLAWVAVEVVGHLVMALVLLYVGITYLPTRTKTCH